MITENKLPDIYLRVRFLRYLQIQFFSYRTCMYLLLYTTTIKDTFAKDQLA